MVQDIHVDRIIQVAVKIQTIMIFAEISETMVMVEVHDLLLYDDVLLVVPAIIIL